MLFALCCQVVEFGIVVNWEIILLRTVHRQGHLDIRASLVQGSENGKREGISCINFETKKSCLRVYYYLVISKRFTKRRSIKFLLLTSSFQWTHTIIKARSTRSKDDYNTLWRSQQLFRKVRQGNNRHFRFLLHSWALLSPVQLFTPKTQ